MANKPSTQYLPYGYGLMRLHPDDEGMFGKRLKRARAIAGLTLEEVADAIGISTSQLSRYESDKRDPRAHEVEKLAALYGVPSSDLMEDSKRINVVPLDEVEGFAEEPLAFSTSIPYRRSAAGTVPELADIAGMGEGKSGEVLTIASGGIVSGHKVRAEWAIPPEMTRHFLGADPSAVFILPVDGDSMEPTLSSGDRVLVDPQSTVPKDAGIFVLDEGFGPIVKRCRYLAGTEPLEIEIISDNPRVSPLRRPADTVRVIGRVRGRWSRV